MKSSTLDVSKILLKYSLAMFLGIFLVLILPLGDSYLFTNSKDILECFANAYYRWYTFFDSSKEYKNLYLILLSVIISIVWFNLLKSFLLVATIILVSFSVSGVTVSGLSILASASLLIFYTLNLKHHSILGFLFLAIVVLISQGLTFWSILLSLAYLIISKPETLSKSLLLKFFFTLLVSFLFSHLPSKLEVPFNAVYVPGYNYPYGIDPLIGFQTETVSIDKIFIESKLMLYGLVTLILTFFITSIPLRKIFFLLSFLILANSALSPDWLKIITPTSALHRTIPNASVFSNSLIFASLVCFLSIYYQRFIFTKIIAIGIFTWHIFTSYDSAIYGTLLNPKIPTSTLLTTPSLYIVKNRLPLPPPNNNYKIASVNTNEHVVLASINQQKIESLFEGKRGARWSTKPNPQKGNEWVSILFKNPARLVGLELNNPNFIGDYPRGINVYRGKIIDGKCDPSDLIYQEPWWRGSVEKTDQGILYLTTANFVKLYFTQKDIKDLDEILSKPIECLKIVQTGKDPFYEWSIEQLKVYILE